MPAYALLMFDNRPEAERDEYYAGKSSMRVYDTLDDLLIDFRLNLRAMHEHKMKPGFEVRDTHGFCAWNEDTWLSRREVRFNAAQLDITKWKLRAYDKIATRIASILADETDRLEKSIAL